MAVGLVSALLEGALVELLEAVGAHEALGVELAHHGCHAATLTKETDIFIAQNKQVIWGIYYVPRWLCCRRRRWDTACASAPAPALRRHLHGDKSR